MDITEITSHCGLQEPFDVYNKNIIFIANAPYINSCGDLETLYNTNNIDNPNSIIYNFTNPPYNFETNNDNSSKRFRQFENFTNEYGDENIYKFIDNILPALLFILSVFMMIILVSRSCDKKYK
jgi:hypothetical protein